MLAEKTKAEPAYVPEVFSFPNGQGDTAITSYSVFPGIKLSFYSVHMDSVFFGEECDAEKEACFMEIHYCCEGRMEQKWGNRSVYLMPGDLSVVVKRQCFDRYSFPLWHYHGVSINVDIHTVPECLSCFLTDVNVYPNALAKRLCGKEDCFIVRSQEEVRHIFSKLYAAPNSIPEDSKKGYFKVKILELFLKLNSIEPSKNRVSTRSLSSMQTALSEKAAAYLEENLNSQITVAELADKFHVSQTHLQNAFKGVYGVPVSSYIRTLKMQSAALRLIHTDATVLEIATEFGYSNAGKFASAFYKIMGETPVEYRKMHSG